MNGPAVQPQRRRAKRSPEMKSKVDEDGRWEMGEIGMEAADRRLTDLWVCCHKARE